MRKHPVTAISDDGAAVPESILLDVLDMAKKTGLPFVEHCEHHESGCMNDGPVAKMLGVEGIASSTELSIVQRDIDAARKTGAVSYTHLTLPTKRIV